MQKSKIVNQIIVVDNNSIDNTAKLAQSVGAYVVPCTQQGKGYAMEEGLKHSINDIVVYIDADISNYSKDLITKLAEPIMAQILYWKFNNVNSNYANFKIQNVFEIKDSALQRDKLLTSDDDIIKELFRQSGITYTPIDTTTYKTLLNVRHTPEEYIRGKYVLAFFVKALLYISQNSTTVLPSKKSSRPTINVGYEDAVAKLCGIMRTPESLRTFFENMNKNLQK